MQLCTPTPILAEFAKRFFIPPSDRVKTKNATTLLKGRKKCDIKGGSVGEKEEREMEKERTVKRSIRIPSKLYEALVEDSRRVGRSSNQVVLDILRRGIWNRGRGEKERA